MMIKLWGYIMKEKNEEDIRSQVYDEVISKQLDDGSSEGLGSRLEEAYTYFNVRRVSYGVTGLCVQIFGYGAFSKVWQTDSVSGERYDR